MALWEKEKFHRNMEANYSSAESPNLSTDDEVYELYSPCYYVHMAMNSILKCLGFRLDESSATPYTITVCTSISLSLLYNQNPSWI